jgi:hypothetical protein
MAEFMETLKEGCMLTVYKRVPRNGRDGTICILFVSVPSDSLMGWETGKLLGVYHAPLLEI